MKKRTNLWFEILIGVLSLLPFIVLGIFYSALPERVPLFLNFWGEVAVWADKSIAAVFRLPMMALLTQIVCLLMRREAWLEKTDPVENDANFVSLKEKSAALTAGLWDWFRILVAVKISAASAFDIFLATENWRFMASWAFAITGFAAFFSVIGAVFYGYRLLKIQKEIRAKFGKSRRDAEYGRAKVYGVFYFDSSDKSIFHNKYLFNFANVWTYVFISCIIAYPLLVFVK